MHSRRAEGDYYTRAGSGIPRFPSTASRHTASSRGLYTPDGYVYWGEYFDNPHRDEVHIYASTDHGLTWNVAYTFPQGAIRHVHNIVYDKWEDCLWVLTGDNGPECRILKASCDFHTCGGGDFPAINGTRSGVCAYTGRFVFSHRILLLK